MCGKHIPSLYSEKPTLSALYTEDNTLFGGMDFPEGIEAATVGQYLLLKYGTLETIFQTPAEAKAAFTLWSTVKADNWSAMWSALQAEYEPLENYNMRETMTDDETVHEYGKSTTRTDNLTHTKTGTETTTPDLTETETPDETNTADSGVYGFDSADAVGDRTNTETRTGTNTRTTEGTNETEYNTTDKDTGTETHTDSGSDTDTRNYELTRSGNIGVTTSQQMLESELELRSKWNMYEIIGAGFMHEFCVVVW